MAVFLVVSLGNTDGPGNQGATSPCMELYDTTTSRAVFKQPIYLLLSPNTSPELIRTNGLR
jgi:hypothetical protein